MGWGTGGARPRWGRDRSPLHGHRGASPFRPFPTRRCSSPHPAVAASSISGYPRHRLPPIPTRRLWVWGLAGGSYRLTIFFHLVVRRPPRWRRLLDCPMAARGGRTRPGARPPLSPPRPVVTLSLASLRMGPWSLHGSDAVWVTHGGGLGVLATRRSRTARASLSSASPKARPLSSAHTIIP